MSYLLDAVGERRIHDLLDRAAEALAPGGLLLLHDFTVEDDRTGPPLAALWLLTNVGVEGRAIALTPGWLGELLRTRGLVEIAATDLIPGITKLVIARKPTA